MTAISLPFAASAPRRAPNLAELSGGYPCGPLDEKLDNWLEWWTTGQIASLISAAGLTPDDALINTLALAVRGGQMNYRAVGGTANALTLTLTPTLTNYGLLNGSRLYIKATAANTAAATLNIDGQGPVPIKRNAGGTLVAGDLVAGGFYCLIYDGTNFNIIGGQGVDLQTGTSTVKAPKLVSWTGTGLGVVTSVPTTTNTVMPFVVSQNQLGTSTFTGGNTLGVGAGEGGLWLIQAAIHFANPGGVAFNSCAIVRNGNEEAIGVNPAGGAGSSSAPGTSALVAASPGDYFQVWGYQQSGGAANTTGTTRTRFSATLISAT